MSKTEELTKEEKDLILQALDLLFQSGAIRGNMKHVSETLSIAQSIERKFQDVEIPGNE